MGTTTRILLWVIAIAGVAGSSVAYICHRRDTNRLRAVARAATVDVRTPADRAIALMRWVHHHTATAKNRDHFVLSALGPTPVQVLETGGDCADRSRLLVALLNALDIPGTMALCFDRDTGRPSHTVVEARVGPAAFMVLDPTYQLCFPKPDGNGYYGLLDLRREPEILDRRLDQRCEQTPRYRPIHWYDRRRAAYDTASTINWNRNAVSRITHDAAWLLWGDIVYHMPRPGTFASPQLACALLCTTVTAAASLSIALGRRRVRRLVAVTPAGRSDAPYLTQPPGPLPGLLSTDNESSICGL